MADFTTSSIFGDLTKVVKARLDKASERQVQIFDKVLYEEFLDWDTPTVGLDFNEIMGKYNISIIAATIGDNSNEPVMDTEGAETFQHSVYNHAITRPLTVQEYRKILALRDSRQIDDARLRDELTKIMWGTVSDPIKAVQNRIDNIFITALSNKGQYEFTAENNPMGGVRESIDYKMPMENRMAVTVAWDDAHKDTVDCFEDIQLMLELASQKTVIDKILIDQSVMSYMLRSKKMKLILNGNDKSSTPIFMNDLNKFMSANGMPEFRIIKRLMRTSKNTPAFKPWNADNMVFVPAGKLGIIKNAYADSELKESAGVSYSNYGRIRVAQWSVGEKENSKATEFAKAESLSIPVITEIDGIFNLNLKGTR